jgi:general secretion pathway protein L
MVLEALSEILPDHTYVTEFRIEANKVRLIGVTRDAASLIELIERSGRFKGASFFAPTTRSSSDANERFHIEVTIQPNATLRS